LNWAERTLLLEAYMVCEDEASFLNNQHAFLNPSNASSFICHLQSVILHYQNGFCSMNAKAERLVVYDEGT
jgi:hypothetical protein